MIPFVQNIDPVTLARVKDVLEIINSVIATAAIIVGGFWTYHLFIKKRQRFPKAEITHQVEQFSLPNSRVLLHVGVRITNKSEVLLSLKEASSRLQQVIPLQNGVELQHDFGVAAPKKHNMIEWPLISEKQWTWTDGEAEIEPGESELLELDFVVSNGIKTAKLYTFVRNYTKGKRDIGWSHTLMCQIEN